MINLFRLLALVLLVAGKPASAEAPRVVASIKPVHSIVAAVMEGVGAPTLLVSGAATPHSYAMRPSDARALASADLVFWVGPALESFLAKPLSVLPDSAKVVRLIDAEGLHRLPVREGGAFEAHEHGHEHGHAHQRAEPGHDHGHDHGHGPDGAIDPHVWLDPHNAEVMATAVAAALADRDPAHAERYGDNARRLVRELEALDAELREAIAPLHGIPYVVFHDAYQYFEAHYGLQPAGSITIEAERAPGARRVAEVRDRIVALGARCVFGEPQFRSDIVDTLIDGTGARAATLDPLGAALDAGPALYAALLRNLAADLRGCLAG
ncbi:MAG: zinc ABC transporter substrate-binding protein [Acetobacterales bacterium]